MSSDKQQKLERYTRKDYGEIVDFPVEIIGRDGVVRRYSFEDSIRLYQRRIIFAPIRYRDLELRDAEVLHCRQRIQQLRHSFFYRFGWGTPAGQVHPEEQFGALAGEVAAFLCRVLRCKTRPEVMVEPVREGGPISTWFVVPRNSENGMLLYVHRFEGTDEDSVREEFFGGLKSLERDKNVSGSGERMVAFHHTNDCGFILTARGEEFAEIVVEEPAEIAENPEPTQWDVLTDMVRRGQYEQALVVAHDLVRKQPWHRQGYMTGSMLASFLGYELTTDEISSLGAMYFPAQAELHYWSGLARRRQGQIAESEAPLRKAVELDQGLIAAQFFLAHTLIDQRKFKQLGLFLAEHSAVKSDDRRGLLLMERMRQWLRWRRVMVWAGVISQLLGLVVVLFAGFIGLVPILSGLIITWVGARAFKSQLNRLTELHRFDDMVYWNRRIHRSTVGHSEAS